jgi:hypothetical protein
MREFAIVLALCAAASGAVSVNAQQISAKQKQAMNQQEITKQQQMQLVDAFVAAAQARDKTKLIALLHPLLRECAAGIGSEYYDFVARQLIEHFPAGKYSRVEIQPISATDQPAVWLVMPKEQFPYPVRPKVRLQIDYIDYDDVLDNKYVSEVLEAAPTPDGWSWISACPNAAGRAFLRKYIADANAQQSEVADMAAKVPPALRAKILKSLAANDKTSAIDAYQKATGSNRSLAFGVVNQIEAAQKPAGR